MTGKAPEIRRQRGIALLITLMVMALCLALSVESHRRIRDTVLSSAGTRTRHQLEWTAVSGVEIAMALLVQDRKTSELDSIQENWALPEVMAEILMLMPFETGDLSVSIEDCLSRIQINALVKPPNGRDVRPGQEVLLDRYLRPIITEHDTADINATTDIINSIKDWLDSGDDGAITGINGAESHYYLGLDPPYEARNGPMRSLSELMLVKGVTREMFFGTENGQDSDEMEGVKGIGGHLTVYGGIGMGNETDYAGMINIGTAPVEVICALLPEEQKDLAQSIVDYRNEREDFVFVNDITSELWYQMAPGCSEVQFDSELVTNKSDFFTITSRAVEGSLSRTVTAVVHRVVQNGQWECEILSWEVS